MKGHCIRLEFRVGGDGVRERTWFERVIRLLRDVRVEERLEELGDGFMEERTPCNLDCRRTNSSKIQSTKGRPPACICERHWLFLLALAKYAFLFVNSVPFLLIKFVITHYILFRYPLPHLYYSLNFFHTLSFCYRQF